MSYKPLHCLEGKNIRTANICMIITIIRNSCAFFSGSIFEKMAEISKYEQNRADVSCSRGKGTLEQLSNFV